MGQPRVDGSSLLQPEDYELLAEIATDPALADCCKRDLIELRQVERIRQRFADNDPAAARLNAVQRVFAAPRAAPEPSGDGLDVEEDDPELVALRQARLHEMQTAASSSHSPAAKTRLRHLSEDDVLELLREQCDRCVCHLAIGTAQGSAAQLDAHMLALAAAHPRVLFARCTASRSGALVRTLGGAALPALLCAREGRVLGCAPLTTFGTTKQLHADLVDEYLQRTRVLHARVPRGVPALKDEDEHGEDADACPLCGRTYPHEHIAAPRYVVDEHDEQRCSWSDDDDT